MKILKRFWDFFRRMPAIQVSFFILLISPSTYTATSSLLEDTKEEMRALYRTSIAQEADNRLWAQERLAYLQGATDDQVMEFSEQVHSITSIPIHELRPKLLNIYETAVRNAGLNATSYENILTVVNKLRTPVEVSDLLLILLTGVREGLELRFQNSHSYPRTLPGDLENHTPRNRQLAEEAIIRRNNEALSIKYLCHLLPSSAVEKAFHSFTQDDTYGGHFMMLQTYALGLADSPPLPDQFLYRNTHNLITQLRRNPAGRLVLELNPYSRNQVQRAEKNFQTDVFKKLGSLEKSAEQMLANYRRTEQKEESFIERALSLAVDATLETVVEELIQEAKKAEKNAQKNAKKKAREKKKKQAAAAAARKALEQVTPEDSLTQDTAAEAADTPLLPLFSQQQAPLLSETEESASEEEEEERPSLSDKVTAAASSGEPPIESLAAAALDTEAPSIVRTLSQDSQGTPTALVPYVYQPFARPAAEGGAGGGGDVVGPAAAAAATPRTVSTLKPRLHGLWEQFWTAPWMEWRDFTKLFMNETLGFGISPMGGSIRQVRYPVSIPSATGKKHFVVHEPHGDRTTLGPATLRDIREHLARDFRWSLESFQAE